MKINVGKCIVLAAVTGVTAPLISLAQNLSSGMGRVDRSVERLTLLTGPNLLSPGDRPLASPQARPSLVTRPGSGYFQFVPATEQLKFDGAGSLRANERATAIPAVVDGATSQPGANFATPASQLLRFESTVPRTPVALPKKAQPATSRD